MILLLLLFTVSIHFAMATSMQQVQTKFYGLFAELVLSSCISDESPIGLPSTLDEQIQSRTPWHSPGS